MTEIDELRDRLAELCGWRFCPGIRPDLPGEWIKNGVCCRHCCEWFDGCYHPFPPGDLTALAAAWPEGWWWVRDTAWIAGRIGREVEFPDAGDEYADRLRLTVAVLEAERAGKGEG